MPYQLRINVSVEQVRDDGGYLGGAPSPFVGAVGQLVRTESVREVLTVIADVEEAITKIVADAAEKQK